MKFDIMTLFPDMVHTVLTESIIGRAIKADIIELECHNIRDYSENKHRNVDDTPYGGGVGMVMAAPPIYNCYEAVRSKNADKYSSVRTVYMSPKGSVLTQQKANELLQYDNIIILCGHYEGVDQRVLDEIIDEEISVGDYVLTGGELPACILVDCVSRLVDGVLSSPECHEGESIANGLLEYPQYTRPYEFHGQRIPDVLISGHHGNIEKWRLEQSMALTGERRPEMLERYLANHPVKEKKKRRRRKEEENG